MTRSRTTQYITRSVIGMSLLVALTGTVQAQGQFTELSGDTPAASTGTLINVVDGDTFDVALGEPRVYQRIAGLAKYSPMRQRYLDDRAQSIRVRLANVQVAEAGTQAGDAITEKLTIGLEGQPVYVQCYDWGDHYRLICTLGMGAEGQDGDLGFALIRDGNTEYVTHWGENPFYHDFYQQAEAQ